MNVVKICRGLLLKGAEAAFKYSFDLEDIQLSL